MRRPIILLAFNLILFVFSPPLFSEPCANRDSAGIQNAMDNYRKAFLANDEDAVMNTLSDDATLMPASSKNSITGGKEIREYWWPKGSPFSIEEFDQALLAIDSCGDLGYVRGTSRVAWSSWNNGAKTRNESISSFVAVLKRTHQGWRIILLSWYQV